MTKQEKAAKVIRVITVPPVLVMIMLTILFFKVPDIFAKTEDYWMSVFWLGIFPVLAYPLQNASKKWKEKGREMQRKLAFVCSIIGYLCALFYGVLTNVSSSLMLIYITYAMSVLLLIIVNKFLKIRASGHACSVFSPFILLTYWGNWKLTIGCLVVVVLSFWASIKLKRHLPKDIVAGCAVMLLSFGIALLVGG